MAKVLLKIKGFSEIKVDKVKEAARKCMVCSRDVSNSRLFATPADNTAVAKQRRLHYLRRAVGATQALLSPFYR